MQIIELDQNQKTHQNTEIAVAGVVRATYTKPFSYFLIEDASGTLICQPNGNLPWPGAHIEVTGQFVVETPEQLHRSTRNSTRKRSCIYLSPDILL